MSASIAPSRIPASAYGRVPAIPDEHRVRDFGKIGVGIVDQSAMTFGTDTSEFSPAEYANYAATSIYVYAAVKLRASNLGQLPVKLYKRKRNGDEVEVTSGRPGSLYELVQKVNPYWSMRRLIRMTEWSRCLQGSAYWYVNRGQNGRGAPTELWWVRPDRMRVIPHPQQYIAGYLHESTNGGQAVPFATSEMLWFPLDNPIDEFAGLSPIAAVRLSIDTAYDAMRSNRNMHRNGTRISGIIGPSDKDQSLSKTQVSDISQTFGEMYRGVDSAHKLAVIGHAIGITQLSMTPKDAEFIEQLKWTLGDVARAFGVPPGKLADREHSTYNNVKQEDKEFWSMTLIPEADDISDQLTEFLLPMFPGEADRIALDYSEVTALQEDMAELTDQASTWYSMGVPLNPLLKEYNPSLLPSEGGYEWGDKPKSTAPAVAPPDPAGEPDPEAEAEMAADMPMGDPARAALYLIRELRALPAPATRAIEYGSAEHELRWRRSVRVMDRGERAFLRELRRLFTRQQESVLARLRKKRGAIEESFARHEGWSDEFRATLTRTDDDVLAAPFDVAQWTETFQQAILPILTEIVEDAGVDTFDLLGLLSDFDVNNPLIRQWLETAAFTFAQEVNKTTIEQLRAVLQEGIDNGASIDELAETIKQTFGEISDTRAETIARTETAEAVNAGSIEAARQSSVVAGKVWLSARDQRVRESHIEAHGQERKLDEAFDVGGSSLMHPGDGNGAPEEIINCRCVMTWILKD